MKRLLLRLLETFSRVEEPDGPQEPSTPVYLSPDEYVVGNDGWLVKKNCHDIWASYDPS